MRKIDTTVRDKIKSIVETMGYEFVGCELKGEGRDAILRIFIDTEKGITVTDCSRVSHQVSAWLDVEDPIPGNYSLEISSPGLNRPLFEIEHYQQQIGHRIKIQMHIPVESRRKFIGILSRVEGGDIHLIIDGEEIVLPFSNIERANVIADIR